MFKKLRGLFSLERRILDGVSNHLAEHAQKTAERLVVLEKDIAAKAQQIDKLQAELNKRVGKIEILFADELAVKDKAREENVKTLRLGK